MIKQLILLTLFVSLHAKTNTAQAAEFSGHISFSYKEVAEHRAGLGKILENASQCLSNHYASHKNFQDQWGISKYYGQQSDFSKKSYREKLDELLRKDLPGVQLLEEMESISCVGLTIRCLRSGFKAAGQSALWEKIFTYVKRNNVDGSSMQHALQKLGWKIYYWNPETSKNRKRDIRERVFSPTNKGGIWGYHSYRYDVEIPKGRYYKNYVDDATTMVNFKKRVPKSLARIPFILGTAHTGYHVFATTYGTVYEAHGSKSYDYNKVLERGPFDPQRVFGGFPNGFFRSGLLAIPPGYRITR